LGVDKIDPTAPLSISATGADWDE